MLVTMSCSYNVQHKKSLPPSPPPKKMSSFKSSENIQKKEGGSDRSVSNTPFSSSVALKQLAIKARERIYTVSSSFNKAINPKIDTNPNGSE